MPPEPEWEDYRSSHHAQQSSEDLRSVFDDVDSYYVATEIEVGNRWRHRRLIDLGNFTFVKKIVCTAS